MKISKHKKLKSDNSFLSNITTVTNSQLLILNTIYHLGFKIHKNKDKIQIDKEYGPCSGLICCLRVLNIRKSTKLF